MRLVYLPHGASEDDLQNVTKYIDGHPGDEVSILHEDETEIARFRDLQTCVKLGFVSAVVVNRYEDIGSDGLMRRENELFLKRNGVELVTVCPRTVDGYYELVNGIKGYFSVGGQWAARHGDRMPVTDMYVSKRPAPYGYVIVDGRIKAHEGEAKIVREIFQRFGNGEPMAQIKAGLKDLRTREGNKFFDSTIRAMLRHGRYIGIPCSRTNTALPAILTYAEWFLAAERFENSTADKNRRGQDKPCFDRVSVKGFRKIRFSDEIPTGKFCANVYNINTQEFNDFVKAQVAVVCAELSADRLFKYAVRNRKALIAMRYDIDAEMTRAKAAFDECLVRMNNSRSAVEAQKDMYEISQRLFLHTARQRRLETEIEMYNVTRDEIEYFLARGRNVNAMPRVELEYFANVLIRRIGVKDGSYIALFNFPKAKGVNKAKA